VATVKYVDETWGNREIGTKLSMMAKVVKALPDRMPLRLIEKI